MVKSQLSSTFEIYGEAAKFQTKQLSYIVELIRTIKKTILMRLISLRFHITSVVGEQSGLVHPLSFETIVGSNPTLTTYIMLGSTNWLRYPDFQSVQCGFESRPQYQLVCQ